MGRLVPSVDLIKMNFMTGVDAAVGGKDHSCMYVCFYVYKNFYVLPYYTTNVPAAPIKLLIVYTIIYDAYHTYFLTFSSLCFKLLN